MDMPTPMPPTQTPPTPPAVAPASAPPAMSAPTGAPAPMPPSKHHNHKAAYAVAATVIILLIALGIIYAAVNGLISLPFLSPKPPTIDEISQALQKIDSAEGTAAFSFKVVPREPNVQETDLSVLSKATPTNPVAAMVDPKTMIAAVPSDLDVEGSLTTNWQRTGNTDSETMLTGSFAESGFSAQFDGGVRTVGSDAYIQVNKLPIPFVDVSALNGAWVKIPGGFANVMDITTLMSGQDPSVQVFKTTPDTTTPAATEATAKRNPAEEIGALVGDAMTSGGITVAVADAADKINGEPAWDYTITWDDQKFFAAFNNLYDTRKDRFPDIDTFMIFTQRFTDDQIAAVSALDKNSTEHLFVSKKSRLPISLVSQSVIAPSATDAPKLANKEIKGTLTLSLAKVNEPVQVDVPAGALSVTQAVQKLSGETDDQVNFQNQLQVIDDLRSALKAYKDEKGVYPASLGDLMGQTVSEDAGFGLSGSLSTTTKTVVNVPNDQYTQAPFVYALDSTDGYHLAYQLKFADSVPTYESDGYVDGTNTATAFDNSTEGYDPTYDDDTDGDGLTDGQEQAYGTNPYLADTDGDGFTDKQEIDGGYDPLHAPN